jgi:glycolate oxidase iron-sulfur subunit
MDSPRGRIYLMKAIAEGKEQFTPTVVRHFDSCLGCLACVTACPSGVKYDALIEETRAELERVQVSTMPRRNRGRTVGDHRAFGERMFRRLIFAILPYPRRLRVLLFLQLLYLKSGLRWLVHAIGLPRLWSRRLRNLEALMPPVRWRQLGDRMQAFTPAQGPRRAGVALLAGCVQRVYFPQVHEATVRVLTAEGCDVVVPPALGCCGALSLHSGRADEARGFARAAIAILEGAGVDTFVVNAAGCGSSMKGWGRLLRDDPAWATRAAAAAAKVRDVNEYLAGLGAVASRHPLRVKVAYHDACHLAHAQRIRSEPRTLLSAIPGLDLLELADSDQCCGSAGIYNLLEAESSYEIGQRKVENVLAVAPELLVTANPGCALQVEMLLRERGHSMITAHPIEVLDASIRGSTWVAERG